ncbi:MAG: hypothetical protein ACI9MB_001480 [Verrucomicrobiales bacterium]|jgi:uncharacterized protein (TIGR02596 family)
MKSKYPASKARPRVSAFTLIEIMVVLAVIAIIATMAVPALNGVLKSSKMTQSSDEFERDLARAHAAAQRDNYPIEFRFYQYSDPEQPNSKIAYRAYQAVKRVRDPSDHRDVNAAKIEPLFDVKQLPPGIIFSADTKYSSLFELSDIDGNTASEETGDEIPRVDQAEYKAFYFRPDGSTSMASGGRIQQWFVTIAKESLTGSKELPPDFVTLQVDAYNGQIRRYEKGL